MEKQRFHALISQHMEYKDTRRDKREQRNFNWVLNPQPRQCDYCRRKIRTDHGIIHKKKDEKWIKFCNNCRLDITLRSRV